MGATNVGLGSPTDAEAKVRAYFERFNETRESQLEALHPEINWHIRADLPGSHTLQAMRTSSGGTPTGSRRSGPFTSNPSR